MKPSPAAAALTDALDAAVWAVILGWVEAEAGQVDRTAWRVAIGWLHRPYSLLRRPAPGQLPLLGGL